MNKTPYLVELFNSILPLWELGRFLKLLDEDWELIGPGRLPHHVLLTLVNEINLSHFQWIFPELLCNVLHDVLDDGDSLRRPCNYSPPPSVITALC